MSSYIGTTAAEVASALEPAVVTLATLYVMLWGYLQATGQIDEPIIDGIKRIARIVLVLGVGLKLWLYNTVVVDSAFNGPQALAAAISGSADPVGIVDQIIFDGGDAASALIQKGGILDGNFSYYLAGAFVYVAIGLAAIYTIFLLSLSKIALSILLALGPLFIGTLLFNVSRRFFDAWISQLANYGLIAILATLATTLLMHVLTVTAQQTAALGTGIQIADGVRVCFAAVLIFLLMRQVMPIAAGLASGVSLNSFGALSRSVSWLGRQAVAAGS
ncbi:MAG TPA: type IV secretion system protein [Steroidobacteraceae bacterium]